MRPRGVNKSRARAALTVTALALTGLVALARASAGNKLPTGLRSLTRARWLPGRIIVRFNPWVDPLSRRQSLAEQDAVTIQKLGLPGLEVVRVAAGLSVPEAVAAFRADPAVAYAVPDYLRHALATPNDPRYPSLWGLTKIDAPDAWDISTGSSGVTVAVVDTGIASGQLDLAANIVPGFDFITGDSDPADANGHGTHVSGTIGAVGNNARGVTGVNWNVSLMPLRVLDASGEGSDDDITNAFLYACAHGARVVNASLGGSGYSPATRDAIASAGCANTLFVFAAGNGGADGVGDDNDTDPTYPCNHGSSAPGQDNLPNVVCVAATGQSDSLTSFSNYGSASVDLAAPGLAIPSTYPAYDLLGTEGFETGLADWSAEPPWGRVSTVHHTGSWSATDSPAGPYANNADTSLTRTAPINLTGRKACGLDYALDLAAADSFDGVIVSVSDDAVIWDPLSGWTGDTSGEFVELTDDLSDHDGKATAYPQFEFISGPSGTADGVYVDDVSIQCLAATQKSYAVLSGTSMATPHVAGVAALVVAAHPSFTTAQVKDAVLGGVDPVGALSGKVGTGGRLNACKALGGCLTPPTPPPPPPPPSPPPNDFFADAQELVGLSGARTADTNAAGTKEGGEPSHAGNEGGASVWYRWTAPTDGVVTFSTATSGFDTLLAAYTGASVAGLTEVARNDDQVAGQTLTSRIELNVSAGTTYRVAVDGYDDGLGAETGDIKLAWNQVLPPPPTPPSLAIAGASVLEGNSATGNLSFAVTLSAAAGSAVTVKYATSDVTATAGSDYDATAGTLIFDPGQASNTISVPIHGDTAVEPDETFAVDLSSASGATISQSHAIGTILNDGDGGPPVPFCRVPKVVGKLLTTAKVRIRKAKCRVGRITYKASKRAMKNRVLAQSPRAGKRVTRGKKVNLLVGRERH